MMKSDFFGIGCRLDPVTKFCIPPLRHLFFPIPWGFCMGVFFCMGFWVTGICFFFFFFGLDRADIKLRGVFFLVLCLFFLFIFFFFGD
jgi:hypothetical protein